MMLRCKGLSDITTNVPIAKMNIDIKCAVLKNSIPGGGVSWMLFCAHHPTGKIFLELEVHHMAGRLLSLHVIMLSISTWKKNSLGILVTVAAQMEEGSLGFTASSFKPFVNPCGLGKLSDWRRGTILKHHIKYKLIAQFQNFFIFGFYMISWIMPAFWAVLSHDLLGDRCTEDISINKTFLFHHIKQTDSMLPWICTVTDQVLSTSCTTFLFSPHFDAIEV